jgi:hypothetical protein
LTISAQASSRNTAFNAAVNSFYGLRFASVVLSAVGFAAYEVYEEGAFDQARITVTITVQ